MIIYTTIKYLISDLKYIGKNLYQCLQHYSLYYNTYNTTYTQLMQYNLCIQNKVTW